MLNIDYIAHHNGLQNVPAWQKLLLSIGALCIVTFSRNNSVALWTLLVMSGVIVLYAKIPLKAYVTLMLAPLGFGLVGILTIVVSISFTNEVNAEVLWHLLTPLGTIYILPSDVTRAINIFLVAFSASSCLYLLILTTPIYEISPILLKCKVPTIVIELIELIYRFIFLFLQTSKQIYTAQQARLGYKSYKMNFQSLVLLISVLFRSIFFHYEKMTLAMKSRNIEHFIIPDVYLMKKKWQMLPLCFFVGHVLVSVVLIFV